MCAAAATVVCAGNVSANASDAVPAGTFVDPKRGASTATTQTGPEAIMNL